MRIANPMYDAVFKHLLEDPASAKPIVGAILGEEIESLEMAPQEAAVQVGSAQPATEGTGFTLLRVDFAATVRTAAGEHLRVLIEVQKARYSDDVMRFRRYLGTHYGEVDRRQSSRHLMLTEDEIIGAWEGLYRENRENREALAEQQKTLAEQQKTLAEQQKAIAGNRQSIADQQEALAARDRTIDAQRAEIEALRRRLGDGG